MRVGNKRIGNDQPCFIVAEAGVNHNGKFDLAKKLIDVAAESGCDAVKFQVFRAQYLYPKTAGKIEWTSSRGICDYSLFQVAKQLELPKRWLPELVAHAERRGILFFASAFDEKSADFLEKLGIKVFKIASATITHLPLIAHIARKKKPIFLSTGGAYLREIDEAVETVERFTRKLALLHCVLKYPAPLNHCNLGVLKTLKHAFPHTVVGYSDHTENPIIAPVAAVALGAKIIEKHITLDRKMSGPDHFFAADQKGLRKMVRAIRMTEKTIGSKKIKIDKKLLGSSRVTPSFIERPLREFTYCKIFAKKDIGAGERLSKDNLIVLRPGRMKGGLEPKYFNILIEKEVKAARSIKRGHPIMWEHLFLK